MKHYGDITKIHGATVEPVNVIIGGSPCQDLSVAGKQKGIKHTDNGDDETTRSGLFMEQLRIIKEMRRNDIEHGRTGIYIRPRFMVWENVPGAFSSNKGADFGAVLEETVKVVCEKAPSVPIPKHGWPNAGCLTDVAGKWSVAWRVFDAQFWGVPQRRKRIALVADFGGLAAPEVLFERESVCGNTEPRGSAGKDTAAETARGVGAAVRAFCFQGNGIDRAETAGCNGKGWTEGVSYTLNTIDRHAVAFAIGNGQSDNTGLHEIPGALNCMHDQQAVLARVKRKWIVRRLTPLECERLQGYPDSWTDIGSWTDLRGKIRESADSARYKALGNSIALPPWVFVLSRLTLACGAECTMGSLFDGIGGFPLIWERLNGAGSCLWASEIDEFAIAVTKKRFCSEVVSESRKEA